MSEVEFNEKVCKQIKRIDEMRQIERQKLIKQHLKDLSLNELIKDCEQTTSEIISFAKGDIWLSYFGKRTLYCRCGYAQKLLRIKHNNPVQKPFLQKLKELE